MGGSAHARRVLVDELLRPLDAQVDDGAGLVGRGVVGVGAPDLADHGVELLVALTPGLGAEVVAGAGTFSALHLQASRAPVGSRPGPRRARGGAGRSRTSNPAIMSRVL